MIRGLNLIVLTASFSMHNLTMNHKFNKIEILLHKMTPSMPLYSYIAIQLYSYESAPPVKDSSRALALELFSIPAHCTVANINFTVQMSFTRDVPMNSQIQRLIRKGTMLSRFVSFAVPSEDDSQRMTPYVLFATAHTAGLVQCTLQCTLDHECHTLVNVHCAPEDTVHSSVTLIVQLQ